MLRAYSNFIRGVSANAIGRLGVALTTASFVLFLLFELFSILGIITNAYVGLISYLTLPAAFVVGLVLIPLGWLRQMKVTGRSARELLRHRFEEDDLKAGATGARVFRVVLVLTLVNVAFLGAGASSMLSYMDQAEFCGTACHVMNPEWTAYQDSPHANVDCVECHVGEGIRGLYESKVSGLRQTVLYGLGRYSKPVPTPVHQLSPARETCLHCHGRLERSGVRTRTRVTHGFDLASTPSYSTVSFALGRDADGPHWHARDDVEIRYASADDLRERILWVELRESGAEPRRFRNVSPWADPSGDEAVRAFDCVDCHNRVAHRFETPEQAVDRLIGHGRISRKLPEIKRIALAAITNDYGDGDAARRGIENAVRNAYRRDGRAVATGLQPELDDAVAALQAAHARNVHREMEIGWGTYPDQNGHPARARGCFRCHNQQMVDEAGAAIPFECTTCHAILADESSEPFAVLTDPREDGPDAERNRYLREHFERVTDGVE